MCFVPKVSMATALIEFFVAFWIYFKFPRRQLTIFFTIIIILLGLYQFSEFMLCTVGDPQTWGKFGFVAYTLIPAVTLYFTMMIVGYKPNKFLAFGPAIFFIIFAIIDKKFILQGTCSTLFVTIRNKFSYPDKRILPFPIYGTYYYLYLFFSISYLAIGIKKVKEKKRAFIFSLMIFSIIFTIVPPLIMVNVFPIYNIQFPSIYCHFAMLITLASITGLYLEDRLFKE